MNEGILSSVVVKFLLFYMVPVGCIYTILAQVMSHFLFKDS
jgi:hypothetical protein